MSIVRTMAIVALSATFGCSAIVGSRLDDKPEPMDGGATDTGAPPTDSGGGDGGPCEDDDDCPGAEACDQVCNESTGQCIIGEGTGAQCGAGVNDRCVSGICKTLPSCSPLNWMCPQPCTELCIPFSETMGVCILATDLGLSPMDVNGYPCGPVDVMSRTGDICAMGACQDDATLCADDGGCLCNQRCFVFPGGDGGGCGPNGRLRPRNAPCTGLDGMAGSCSAVGICGRPDGT